MSEPHFERLTSLDYSFLVFEGAKTPMHVAATAILQPGSFRNGVGGVAMDQVKQYVAARLHLVPEYRRRLARIPIENHPVWVDDDNFDLNYHIRHSSLPRPGTRAQLQELCARLLERTLDRSRPLWEIWVIEGLEDGQFAMLMKIHHCLVDGVAGVSLMAALFTFQPESEVGTANAWQPRPAPTDAELLAHELRRRTTMSVDALRRVGDSLSEPSATIREFGRRLSNTWSFLRSGIRSSTGTPFGPETSGHRRVRWLSLELSAVKRVKNQLDGTVNDVVLATVAGAVRRYFRGRGVGIEPGAFRVGVPVNLRAKAEADERGNHVWMWLLPLPLEFGGAHERFAAIHRDAEELKQSQQAHVGELVTQALEWTSTNLLPLGIKLINRLQPFDMVVTNVPGPPLPMYMLDAGISELYPHVPLFEGQSLAIALFSYGDSLLWGINADWDNVPDVDDFVQALRDAFAELLRAAEKPVPSAATAAVAREVKSKHTRRRSRPRGRLKRAQLMAFARAG